MMEKSRDRVQTASALLKSEITARRWQTGCWMGVQKDVKAEM